MALPWASAISWLASGGPTLSSPPVISSSGSAGVDRAGVGGGGEGLAVAGVALRVLAHHQLADERGDLGPVPAGGLGQRVGHDRRGDRGGALAPAAVAARSRWACRPGLGGLGRTAPSSASADTCPGWRAASARTTSVPIECPTTRGGADAELRRGRRPGRRRGRSMLMSSVDRGAARRPPSRPGSPGTARPGRRPGPGRSSRCRPGRAPAAPTGAPRRRRSRRPVPCR